MSDNLPKQPKTDLFSHKTPSPREVPERKLKSPENHKIDRPVEPSGSQGSIRTPIGEFIHKLKTPSKQNSFREPVPPTQPATSARAERRGNYAAKREAALAGVQVETQKSTPASKPSSARADVRLPVFVAPKIVDNHKIVPLKVDGNHNTEGRQSSRKASAKKESSSSKGREKVDDLKSRVPDIFQPTQPKYKVSELLQTLQSQLAPAKPSRATQSPKKELSIPKNFPPPTKEKLPIKSTTGTKTRSQKVAERTKSPTQDKLAAALTPEDLEYNQAYFAPKYDDQDWVDYETVQEDMEEKGSPSRPGVERSGSKPRFAGSNVGKVLPMDPIPPIKVFYWNPCSVNSSNEVNSKRKKEMIAQDNPHIIMLAEPFCEYRIPGYISVTGLPLDGKFKSYTAVIYRRELSIEIELVDIDLIILKQNIEHPREAIYYFCVYLSHTEQRRLTCLALIHKYLKKILEKEDPLFVLVGDFNTDLQKLDPYTKDPSLKSLNLLLRDYKLRSAPDMHHHNLTRARVKHVETYQPHQEQEGKDAVSAPRRVRTEKKEQSRIDWLLHTRTDLNLQCEFAEGSHLLSDHYAFRIKLGFL